MSKKSRRENAQATPGAAPTGTDETDLDETEGGDDDEDPEDPTQGDPKIWEDLDETEGGDDKTPENKPTDQESEEQAREYWLDFNRKRLELETEEKVRHLFIVGRGGRSSELAELLPKLFEEVGEYATAHELAVFERVAELAGVALEFSPEQLEATAPLKAEYAKAIR